MTEKDSADAEYRQLRRRSLWLVAPALAGVLALLALVAWKQGLLTATSPLYFMTETATGISHGMPVKLNGFVVGQVTGIELLPPSAQSAQRVRVVMDIHRAYLDYVPKTTRARLAQEGVIGQAIIELVPERYDARAIHAGEMLPFERSRGLAEIAVGLEAKVNPVLDNARELTDRLADPRGDLHGLLAEGRAAVAGLAETNGEVQATMAETRRAVSALSGRAEASLRRADRTLATVEKDVPALMSDFKETAANAKRASEDAAVISARSAEQVPRILDSAEQAIEKGNALVGDVRRLWPMSALSRERGDGLAETDSLDGIAVPLEPEP